MEAARQASAADDRIGTEEMTTQSAPSGTISDAAAAEPLEPPPSAELQAACTGEETEAAAGSGAAASAGVADDEVDPKLAIDLPDATSTKASSKKKQRKNKKKK